MRVRASEYFSVEQTRKIDIIDVFCPAGDDLICVDSRRYLAYKSVTVGHICQSSLIA
jgi:hypothetical protein